MGDGKGNVDQDRTVGMARQAETSRLAFATTPDRVRTSQRARIEDFVKAAGTRGATADEIETTLGLPHQTASARISEMHRAGIIHYGKETRRTSRNKESRVYRHGPPAAGAAQAKARGCKAPSALSWSQCMDTARAALNQYKVTADVQTLVYALGWILDLGGEATPLKPKETLL